MFVHLGLQLLSHGNANTKLPTVPNYGITKPNGSMVCFTGGMQVVIGAIVTEADVFVQYVTITVEDVKVGDLVHTYNTVTGTVEQQEVTAVFVRQSDHVNYLTIEDEHGNIQVIEVTDGHPFWVVTNTPDLDRVARDYADGFYHENIGVTEFGYWVEAKDLQEGDVFLGANGELSTLVAKERVAFPEGIRVYNFTVDGNHNYFVIAKDDEFGQTCILVHNGDYGQKPSSSWWDILDADKNGVNKAASAVQNYVSKKVSDFLWKGSKKYSEAFPKGPPPAPTAEEQIDNLQWMIDKIGYEPTVIGSIADAVNSAVFALRGQYGNAGVSLIGAVPLAGAFLKNGGKVAMEAAEGIMKHVGDVVDAIKKLIHFPVDPKAFNPEGLIRQEYKNGEIIKWIDPKTNKAKYEWNADGAGGHYHITPDGKNRIPHPDTGDTHIPPGTIIPNN